MVEVDLCFTSGFDYGGKLVVWLFLMCIASAMLSIPNGLEPPISI